MDSIIEKSVECVINAMRENLGEQITLDDMARTAMFSKFHFSRIFQRVTGISPGRFLSALRLQEAKHLLVTTSLTVADISHTVGYNSIGTFSSRFRGSVGMSPTEYRQSRGFAPPLPAAAAAPGPGATVAGRVWAPAGSRPGHVVVGLYADRIVQGVPVRHTILPEPGEFRLDGVPEGRWYLLANTAEPGAREPATYVAALGPVEVRAAAAVRPAELWLRPRCVFDPPALLAQADSPMWTTAAWAAAADRDRPAVLPGA